MSFSQVYLYFLELLVFYRLVDARILIVKFSEIAKDCSPRKGPCPTGLIQAQEETNASSETGSTEVFRPICTSPSSAFTPYQNTVTPTTSPSVQSNSMDTTVQMDPGGDLLSEEGVSQDKNGGQEKE